MSRPGTTKVFISYAHRDGAILAKRLQRSLVAEEFDVWLDSRRLTGAAAWTTAIERAIDASHVVLALISPGSYASDMCRAEQLRSLRRGRRVIPLLAEPGSDIPLHLEVTQYLDFTDRVSYRAQFQLLLEAIRADAGVALKDAYRVTRIIYVTAPPTVTNLVDRPDALRALRDDLLADHNHQPLALTALAGMGGIGKTVLAHALTRDQVVQDTFPDGIVWLTVGREPLSDLRSSFREIGKAIGLNFQHCDTVAACMNQYKTALAEKAVLIVVDDVWRKSDLEPFIADSRCSRILFTTRDASIARFMGARAHTAELLGTDHARQLLAKWACVEVERFSSHLDSIIRECGNLPLAISTVGAMLRGATLDQWQDTLRLLREADLTAIADQLPWGQESFFRAVEVSFDALPSDMRGRYKALAVLLEDMTAPLPIMRALWGVGEAEARRIARFLVDRSLAQREQDTDSIRLHDLQLDFVRAQYGDEYGTQKTESSFAHCPTALGG